MLPYFDEQDSIVKKAAGRTQDILATVAGRFIGAHPKQPPVYRTYNKQGFRRDTDYRYEIDLAQKLKDLKEGQFVYVWGKLWSEQEADVPFSVSCFSPVRVFVSGELKFQSNLNDDVFPDRKTGFRTKLCKGWNHFVLEFVKTGTGCGGRFGTGSVKGFPLHFLAPAPVRDGQEGWIYSEPQDAAWSILPGDGMSESAADCRWFPERDWSEDQASQGCFARVCGSSNPGQQAFAWSKLEFSGVEPQNVVLKGTHDGPFTAYLNGEPVHREGKDKGAFEIPLRPSFGSQDLVIRSTCFGTQWGISFEPLSQNDVIRWTKPYPVEGLREPWLYLGPFADGAAPEAGNITRLDSLFGRSGEAVFWRADQPDAWVRPYLENAMFGKWNYPLGVTLYGILEAGKVLGNSHYIDYVADFIESSTALDAYSLWDQEQYGAPGMNHQLTLIDSLDDCGSFGATMLQTHKQRELKGAKGAADRIAYYIAHVQDRLPDGALYRVRGTTDFMKNTMWCDDLYMSTPFLCRYYEMTGDHAYLDDAARQFLLYKQRLFMPEQQIMHHVYDYKFNRPNGVPWGRGNGWVLFSLTELLAVMPENHELRDEVLSFFRELCEGYLRLQDSEGLWHQVLTDPESYAEASCTSMFVYAFARGVRFGWLAKPQPYVQAVLHGWDGLARACIDKHGNVYGVCRGSGYSYNKLYYKDELSWQLNDTHGIGIVLLAGIETIKLRRYLSQSI
ncbi:glycoside hydrolase family 88/105 protein [Paenibacillus alginolyticus]|uniref:Glycoside hydrolase family 88 protein n=1 Tax=Paenibacillus alginolyticus TaxID=59839 RepID=A0ABT4G8G6_9BACL|nr:glycoside hydrolase family 88 protein [Paenibacillus alginolyticus]MCY9692476.1 glycoside hydrolase family 88 protein [Paenibacillus alginolyticus]MEC0144268.1 glycoside hydrolase family 88 protein [Paenibacillus alginolyticus]